MKMNKDISDVPHFKVFPSHALRAKLLEAMLLEQEGTSDRHPSQGRGGGDPQGKSGGRVQGGSCALEAEGDSSNRSTVTTERHGDSCHVSYYLATTTLTLSQG